MLTVRQYYFQSIAISVFCANLLSHSVYSILLGIAGKKEINVCYYYMSDSYSDLLEYASEIRILTIGLITKVKIPQSIKASQTCTSLSIQST